MQDRLQQMGEWLDVNGEAVSTECFIKNGPLSILRGHSITT